MNIDEILKKLQGVFETSNGWGAGCPAHDDAKQSLSIAVDGPKTLLFCHAGCATTDIVAAMGLQMRDLFTDGNGKRTVEAIYPYHDKNNKLLYQIVRESPRLSKQGDPMATVIGCTPWKVFS